VVFPAGSFAESDGTFVNNEGRAQRFFQVFVPQDPIVEAWALAGPCGGAHDGAGPGVPLEEPR